MGFKYYPMPDQLLTASAVLINQFQASLTDLFNVSSDVFDINEESVFASGSYVSIKVRITSAVDVLTQTRLGDDFKRILFSDINHSVYVGMKYSFSDNTWIGWNIENIKTLTSSITVRRCNNVLRWMSSSGSEIYSEPCAIEYEIAGTDNNISSDNIVTPNGLVKVYTQQNSKTNTITENQRFLFGSPTNWVCFRVQGGGIRNFLNQKTVDNTSSQLLMLKMDTNYTNNDTDDLINGIADFYKYTSSGSSTQINNIVVSPNDGIILEGENQTFDVRYYSGSTVLSGSFIFSVSGSMVPNNNYTFSTLSANTFNVTNNTMYLDYPLNILCSGSSGSRIFEISLSGEW
jgi:hypothetical protein